MHIRIHPKKPQQKIPPPPKNNIKHIQTLQTSKQSQPPLLQQIHPTTIGKKKNKTIVQIERMILLHNSVTINHNLIYMHTLHNKHPESVRDT